ncbi:alpha beta-hydrolase [Trichoderma arundinaceum]|uniref:Alpha beta-hydrolase n=1 Tax=Trichoderma arundinaceum TaxID=490622 RepID=A0A395NWR8_TRIAR|nr:alpha beta-hydrolase [Trichoderma arundinaceum]
MSDNAWELDENKSGLVSIGSHRLQLNVSGPPRKANEPVAIIMAGLTSSVLEWPAATRLLSRFVRTFSYERSGFGASDNPPPGVQPTSTRMAVELDLLLKAADIKPPYIIIAHSYAGITSREFIHLHRENLGDIAGVVFVDANTEDSPATYPDANASAVLGDLDGLRIRSENCHKLSSAEWQALLDEEASTKHQQTADAEVSLYKASAPVLREKGQLQVGRLPLLGDCPVSILQANYAQDLQKIYDAGVAAGNGTETQRSLMRRLIVETNETEALIQKEMLRLSARTRFTFIPDTGHSIHMERPDVIAEHVCWVLDQLKSFSV